jgi:hypothetical protein
VSRYRAHTVLWGLGTAADILVWSRQAFDGRRHSRASLPTTVVREGRLRNTHNLAEIGQQCIPGIVHPSPCAGARKG